MPGKNQHVLPYKNNWGVKGAGNQKYTALYDTQVKAISAARRIAINQKSELLTHGKNGRIRSKDSFGRDTDPPRDTEN